MVRATTTQRSITIKPFQEFSLEIFFRMSWRDPRLVFEGKQPLQVPAKYADDLWDPDIFFPNEKTGTIHNVIAKNEVFKIYPNGTVWHSIRLTLNLGCAMQLEHFPLDHQTCAIKISSYSYDNSSIVLRWLTNPVELNLDEMELPQFELKYWECGDCNEVYRTGKSAYSCKKVNFHFKRQVGFYILQTYIPCILIVMLSWVSFWINKDAVPARITLTVTTMLTMTTQLTTSRSNSMRVSYPKAMDVWYAVCMLFVFGSLLEYAFVNVMTRREKSIVRETIRKRKMSEKKDDDLDDTVSQEIRLLRIFTHKNHRYGDELIPIHVQDEICICLCPQSDKIGVGCLQLC
ncbi:hypothetical protein CAPTEDRAFT_114881 [Capitella teleta]|uniref:Neurotransmitter-gated ion-channel ligand-binding domain-containing protein n=1 Tax=Capitella teleta TaxID=283909 RepID=R7UE79_CAPTE|nr:hypothetical protein CAPTEDRAFT_114881 [Capitella teleta]|eukprot:ELU04391.1 hypothetical protein CAPTEDRAFT_114881 [Capitella teleta]